MNPRERKRCQQKQRKHNQKWKSNHPKVGSTFSRLAWRNTIIIQFYNRYIRCQPFKRLFIFRQQLRWWWCALGEPYSEEETSEEKHKDSCQTTSQRFKKETRCCGQYWQHEQNLLFYIDMWLRSMLLWLFFPLGVSDESSEDEPLTELLRKKCTETKTKAPKRSDATPDARMSGKDVC